MSKQVTILGAGVTGVSLGKYLSDKNIKVTVLEKTNKIGGMASSFKRKENWYDFGPHKLYSQLPGLMQEFENIAGKKDTLTVIKYNSIYLLGKFFDFPVKIFQIILGISPIKSASLGFGFGWSLFKGFFSNKKPKTYKEYFIKGFGKPAYELLFKDTAMKVWGNPEIISEEMGRKRIPIPNVFEMLKSSSGTDSKGRELSAKFFLYPKKVGVGYISEQLAREIIKKKNTIEFDSKITNINTKDNKIVSVTYKKGNKTKIVKTDFLASTIYLKDTLELMNPKPSKQVLQAANNLKYRGLILVYLIVNKEKVMKDNWIFFPEGKYVFSRVSEHNSFNRELVEKGKSVITAEIPADYDSDLYNSDESYQFRRVMDDLEEIGLVKKEEVIEYFVKKAPRVYPLYDIHYRNNLNLILTYLDKFSNFITLGRQGLYNYNNTDHCLDMSMKATEHIKGVFEGNKNISDWRELRAYFDSYRIVD